MREHLRQVGRLMEPGNALYVGLGFYWAWLFITFYTSVLIPTASLANELMNEIWNWAAWAHAVTLLLCSFFAQRLQPFSMHGAAIFISAAGTCAGTLLIPVSVHLGIHYGTVIGALLVGAATAWTVLSWSVLYSRRGARFSLFAIIASYLLAVAIFFLMRIMAPYVAIATTTLLPALCGLALDAARNREEIAVEDATRGSLSESPRRTFALRAILPLLAVFLYSLCGEVLRGFATIPEGQAILNEMGSYYLMGSAIGLVVMGGIFMLIPLVLRSEMSDLPGVRPTLLIMAAGFLVTALTGATFFVAYAVFGAAFQCFRALVWTYSAHVAESASIPAFRVFGATQGFAALAVVLGVPIASLLGDAVSVGIAQWHTIAAIAVFLMFASAVFVINPRDLGDAWGLMASRDSAEVRELGADPMAEPASADEDPTPAQDGLLRFLRDERGLTAREYEVALLLAKGRSLPFIQSELHIARGTAQTHLVHIYRKLGVHSRQEFLDVIELNGDFAPYDLLE